MDENYHGANYELAKAEADKEIGRASCRERV